MIKLRGIVFCMLVFLAIDMNAQDISSANEVILNECFQMIDLFEKKDMQGVESMLNEKYHMGYTDSELDSLSKKYDEVKAQYGAIDAEKVSVAESLGEEEQEEIEKRVSVLFHFGSNEKSKLSFDYQLKDSHYSLKSITFFTVEKETMDQTPEGS
ncbi:hypothetical protein [Sunxiuqinia indica]|uniref:hypothetical protein n=1 Tax=Sunxiuqinia indica TaxID=2692584 RepID=UPI001358CB47|nr:hypothetical protein [Sunxiuqinia indica]